MPLEFSNAQHLVIGSCLPNKPYEKYTKTIKKVYIDLEIIWHEFPFNISYFWFNRRHNVQHPCVFYTLSVV